MERSRDAFPFSALFVCLLFFFSFLLRCSLFCSRVIYVLVYLSVYRLCVVVLTKMGKWNISKNRKRMLANRRYKPHFVYIHSLCESMYNNRMLLSIDWIIYFIEFVMSPLLFELLRWLCAVRSGWHLSRINRSLRSRTTLLFPLLSHSITL